MAYLKIWDHPMPIPQRLRIQFPEKGGSLFTCPKGGVWVVEIIGVGVAPVVGGQIFPCQILN